MQISIYMHTKNWVFCTFILYSLNLDVQIREGESKGKLPEISDYLPSKSYFKFDEKIHIWYNFVVYNLLF